MERKSLHAKTSFGTLSNGQYHDQTFHLPKLGNIVQLSPDRKRSETNQMYLDRCFQEAYNVKSDAGKRNYLTLFVRSTVMSENKDGDVIRSFLILSGCTRNFDEIAKDEFQNRQTFREQFVDIDTPNPFQ